MDNVDPLKAETQADIDELTDIISQLDIIRVKFSSIQQKQEEAVALADGVSAQVQEANESWQAAEAAAQKAREHKAALEQLIENAKNRPETPDNDLSLEDWLDQLEIPANAIPAGEECEEDFAYFVESVNS